MNYLTLSDKLIGYAIREGGEILPLREGLGHARCLGWRIAYYDNGFCLDRTYVNGKMVGWRRSGSHLADHLESISR